MIKVVKVSRDSRLLSLGKLGTYGLGVENDNLYDTIYFEFDEFVDGEGSLLTSIEDSQRKQIAFPLTKEENGYSLVVTDTLLVDDQVIIQLVVTNGEVVWHSVQAKIKVKPCLDAGSGEMPTAVEVWLETADAKLEELAEAIAECDNMNITLTDNGNSATITITNRNGETSSVTVLENSYVDGLIQDLNNRLDRLTRNVIVREDAE